MVTTMDDFSFDIPPAVLSAAGSNTEDCAQLDVTKFEVELVDCYTNASVLCQTDQILSADLLFSLPLPRLLLPLDHISGFRDRMGQTELTNDSRIAFSYEPAPQSGLPGGGPLSAATMQVCVASWS